MSRVNSWVSCLIVAGAVGSTIFFVPTGVVGQQIYYPSYDFKPMWEIYGINPYFPRSCQRPVFGCQSGCRPSTVTTNSAMTYSTLTWEIEAIPSNAIAPAAGDVGFPPVDAETLPRESVTPDPIMSGPDTTVNEQSSLSDLPVDVPIQGETSNADGKKTSQQQKASEESQLRRLEAVRVRQIKQGTERINKRYQKLINSLDKSDEKYEERRKHTEDKMKKEVESMTQSVNERIQKRIDKLKETLNKKS